MLLLRRWDESLAGKTQGKTTLTHEASLRPELFLVFSRPPKRAAEKQPALSHLCLCVRFSLSRQPLFERSVMDGLKLLEALLLCISRRALLGGQDNGSRWSPQTNSLILFFSFFSAVCTLINGMRQCADVQHDPVPIDYRLHLHGSTSIDQAIKGFVE